MGAVYRPEFFELGLRDVGLSDDDVLEVLAIRDEVAGYVHTIDEDEQKSLSLDFIDGGAHVRRKAAAERASALEQLIDWFRRREVRVERETSVDIRVPLFVLAAPTVGGCAATVQRSERGGRALSWNVNLFGSDLGGSTAVRTTCSWKFSASSGETKVVFIPVTVPIAHVTVLERGKVVGQGPWVGSSTIVSSSEPGLLLLPTGANMPVGEVART
jgi:hypothetical protein